MVFSKPIGEYPGVAQYDTGKAEVGLFKRIGALPPPPVDLLQAAQDMAVKRALLKTQDDPISKCIQRIPSDIPALEKYLHPGSAKIVSTTMIISISNPASLVTSASVILPGSSCVTALEMQALHMSVFTEV